MLWDWLRLSDLAINTLPSSSYKKLHWYFIVNEYTMLSDSSDLGEVIVKELPLQEELNNSLTLIFHYEIM